MKGVPEMACTRKTAERKTGTTFSARARPFEVTKREALSAWLLVKSNKGAGWTDGENLEKVDAKLSKNLYKLWNQMSSGRYFSSAVRRMELSKKYCGTRRQGLPTVKDRVAQQVFELGSNQDLSV